MTGGAKQGAVSPAAGPGGRAGFGAVEGRVREFGLALSLFLAVLAGIALFRARENLVPPLLLAAVLACGLAVLWPRSLWPWQRLAMAVAGAIGWFNTRLLLGVVFYLVLTPLGLLMRWLGKDPMQRGFRPDRSSYWQERPEQKYDPSQDEKQF